MDHAARRTRLVALLGDTGTVVVLGHRPATRDHAADHYPFRQDASFTYFVGLDEPGATALIDLASGETTLFGTEPDLDDQLWHGPRPPLADRAAPSGADRFRPLADLPAAIAAAPLPIHTLPSTRATQATDLHSLLGPDHRPSPDLVRAVAHLREVKDAAELAEIEQALTRTAGLHATAMGVVRPGRSVGEAVRELDAFVARSGGRWAYPVIFTPRGEVLHAFEHEGTMATGDLLLHDGGVTSDGGYAADITRTMPVGGRFDGRARLLHEAVLAAQARALSLLRPGVRHLDVHYAAGRVLLEAFADAGLVRGDLDAATEAGAFGVVFPHGLGHLLGIEVHDMEGLGEDLVGYDEETVRPSAFGPSNLRYGKRLREGTVITVEPGAYLNGPLIEWFRAEGRFRDLWDWAGLAEWVGLGGVRIEDVAVVTSDGAQVLGPPIPKSAEALEAACG